jgi:hypothetical protein
MRYLIAVAALLLAGHSLAETKTVTWTNATRNTDNSVIPATGPGSLARTTVEYGSCTSRNPDVFGTKAGEIFVAAPATSLTVNLVVVQEYCLRAFHSNTYATMFSPSSPGNSGFSNVASTVVQPPTPGVPTNITVTSTRIEPSEWTCRDASGAILTSHTRQDTAQTACTNLAIASLGAIYEIRPSGYRISAVARLK